MSNETPNTPDFSETDLRGMKVGELREKAEEEGVDGASSMGKRELVEAISATHREGGRNASGGDGSRGAAQDDGDGSGGDSSRGAAQDDGDGSGGDSSRGAGPDGGHVRTGPETSKSLKYSQEITSTDDDPERPGRSLVTTNHDVIREWAEARKAVPSTVEGTEHEGHLGVLRFDFPGYGGDRLTEVSWDEWFDTFDQRRLNFIYQEQRSDGSQSNFFRLENPDREDG